jgi:hypothetical protein
LTFISEKKNTIACQKYLPQAMVQYLFVFCKRPFRVAQICRRVSFYNQVQFNNEADLSTLFATTLRQSPTAPTKYGFGFGFGFGFGSKL